MFNIKVMGKKEASSSIINQIKEAYNKKQEPVFTPDTSKGYMYRVHSRDGKQWGWGCKDGKIVVLLLLILLLLLLLLLYI